MIEEITQPQLFNTDPYETVTEKEVEAYDSIRQGVNMWSAFANTHNWLKKVPEYTEGHKCRVEVSDLAPFNIIDLSTHLLTNGIDTEVCESSLLVDLRQDNAYDTGRYITNFVQRHLVYSSSVTEESYEF